MSLARSHLLLGARAPFVVAAMLVACSGTAGEDNTAGPSEDASHGDANVDGSGEAVVADVSSDGDARGLLHDGDRSDTSSTPDASKTAVTPNVVKLALGLRL